MTTNKSPTNRELRALKSVTEDPNSVFSYEKTSKSIAVDLDYYSDSESDDGAGDDELTGGGFSANYVPKRKQKHFEFTNNLAVFRLLRCFVYIQIMGLIADGPMVPLPIIFRITGRGVLFYAIRFYSRPFIDLLYIIQHYLALYGNILSQAANGASSSGTSAADSTLGRRLAAIGDTVVSTVHRVLSNSNFAPHAQSTPAVNTEGITADFISGRNWHAAKYLGHYFYGILFAVMAVLFTLRFWEIHDFTDRNELRRWLHDYIADGWSRRGGLRFIYNILRGCVATIALALALFVFAKEVNVNASPEPRMIGGALALIGSTIFLLVLVGYPMFRATESAFANYVSQNVAYSSTIILKRVLKAKTELALCLMVALYTPILYTFAQALIVVTDWNATLAKDYRKPQTHYVPAYFWAFPPYRVTDRSPDSCPVYSSKQAQLNPQTDRHNGIYADLTLIPTDSFLGAYVYTLSVVCFAFMLIGYGWLFRTLSISVEKEFKNSRWSSNLKAILDLRDSELKHYVSTFSWVERTILDVQYEIRAQIGYWVMAIRWIVEIIFLFTTTLIQVVGFPLFGLMACFAFYGERIAVLMCNSWTLEGRIRARRAVLRAEELTRQQAIKQHKQDLKLQQQQQQINDRSNLDSRGNSRESARSEASSAPPADAEMGAGMGAWGGDSSHHADEHDPDESMIANKRQELMASMIKYDEDHVEIDGDEVLSFGERVERFVYRHTVVLAGRCVDASMAAVWHRLNIQKHYIHVKELLMSLVGRSMTRGNPSLVGGAHAKWRTDQKLLSKCRSLRRLHKRYLIELTQAKLEFTMDHQLTISAFDCTIDTAGLLLLLCPYQWNRCGYFMATWLELSLLAVGAAALNFYVDFTWRIYYFLVIVSAFGVATYLFNPYADIKDRWLEFIGRAMMLAFGVVILYCDQYGPDVSGLSTNPDYIHVPLYRPWESLPFLASHFNISIASVTYLLVDAAMVLFMYLYIFFILHVIGVFGMIRRYAHASVFAMHDHVLNFLVTKAEERTMGYENIFTGIILLQQWDDIIATQRRYALLTYPDVRPATLLPMSRKLIELQWASCFNLTVSNIRSSLGLSLLHIAMCGGESELTQWIIQYHPELTLIEDSQRDTPISIALKESAYYIIKYSEQNANKLQDGTSFGDDDYAVYYREIEEYRDYYALHGDFFIESGFMDSYDLDARELAHVTRKGFLLETKDSEYKDAAPAFASRLKKTAKQKLQAILDGPVSDQAAQDARDAKRLAKEQIKARKLRAKLEAEAALKEKLSLYSKRFPEDEYVDNFESGNMASWEVVGLNVPTVNLFLDREIEKQSEYNLFLKIIGGGDGKNYNENEEERQRLLSDENEGEGKLDSPAGGVREEADIENQRQPETVYTSKTKIITRELHRQYGADMHYVVPSSRKAVVYVNTFEVPANNPAWETLTDWYVLKTPPTGKWGPGALFRRLMASRSKNSGAGNMDDQSLFSGTSQSAPVGTLLHHNAVEEGGLDRNEGEDEDARIAHEQDVRYRLCKYTEILISDTVAKQCQNMKWEVPSFKEFNKMASSMQGRLAQNLAAVANLNPPNGFTRISEWTMGIPAVQFEDPDEGKISMVVKTAVKLVATSEGMARTVSTLAGLRSEGLAALRRVLPGKNTRPMTNRDEFDENNSSNSSALSDTEEENRARGTEGAFNDRVIEYLAETLVSSRTRLALIDCELSVYGRKGWRAIVRSLRRLNCLFVIPSMYTGPKQIRLMHLELMRNDLDDGDAVLLAEVLLYQTGLIYVDLSYNRISGRGFMRMSKVLKGHESIACFKCDHNRIGPVAGKDIGVVLKNTKTLKILSLSHNRLGEMIRYPTMTQRQRIHSAARNIFAGVKTNKSLHALDLSYNNLGPVLAEIVPSSINRHPRLVSLNIAGNHIGDSKGPSMIFALAGQPYGVRDTLARLQFYRDFRNHSMAAANDQSESDALSIAQDLIDGNDPNEKDENKKKPKKAKKLKTTEELQEEEDNKYRHRVTPLHDLNLSDNQLGTMAGYALGALLLQSTTLTALDCSRNALGFEGGVALTDHLEKCYGIEPRDFFKQVLKKMEDAKYTGHNALVRRKVYTNLVSLNVSRNGLGPLVCSGLGVCLGSPNCTLTNLDMSDNPLGFSIHNGGDASTCGLDVRFGLSRGRSLVRLNINNTRFEATQLVTIFGGLTFNPIIQRLDFDGVAFDEPSCLQLAHAMEMCRALAHISLKGCAMGPKGAVLIANRIKFECHRLTYVDLSGNMFGPMCALIIGECLSAPNCAIERFYFSDNALMEEGAELVLDGLKHNMSITDLDLSSNHLGPSNGETLGLIARGIYEKGIKIADCPLRRLVVHNNPDIGPTSAKHLFRGLALAARISHIEASGINLGPSAARVISSALRDVGVSWTNLDISRNAIGRDAMNNLFWSLRQNRHLRCLKVADNKIGPNFGCTVDALLKHGISLVRCLRVNVLLRELDLSFNGLQANAGVNLFEALLDNHTLKRLNVRGNVFDDEIADSLLAFLNYNNVVESLDLGDNKCGFNCCFAIAEGLEMNHSIRYLNLDFNQLSNASAAPLEAFMKGIMMNCTLRRLNLDGNRLGPIWGVGLSEALARNNTLVEVSLRDNHLDGLSGRALVNVFEHNMQLMDLGLTKDEIGLELYEEFKQAYRRKRAFVEPDVDSAPFETAIPEHSLYVLDQYSCAMAASRAATKVHHH